MDRTRIFSEHLTDHLELAVQGDTGDSNQNHYMPYFMACSWQL